DIVIVHQASSNSNGGIYYLDGTGFKSTGANITMAPLESGGVMFFNAPSNSNGASQAIDITGNPSGTLALSALTSGPYTGILVFQDRSSSIGLNISGSGSFNLEGTFYAPNANLSATGNGAAVIGSQYITRTLTLGGGGAVIIDYHPNGTAPLREVKLV